MKINNEYEIVIDSVDYIGNGVTRIDNIVTFVFGALKDEKVKIKIIEINKHYAIGKIIEIINKSKDRIDVKCPVYDKCGGCNFLHTSYENEAIIKKEYLDRLFNMNIEYNNTKNEYNYRNKVTLHVLEGKLGYFNDKTHDLCELDSCMLLNPKINLKISDIKKYNLLGLNEIMIRCINNEIMIHLKGNLLNKDILNIECDSLYYNDKLIKGKEYLIDEINNYKFSIFPNSFYQVNRECMENIYNTAKKYLSKKSSSLLDLYCGTGTIGIWLSDNFNEITGIEINEDSIKNANINKDLNDLKNIKFIKGDAKIAKGKYDAIVVDPPRSGLSSNVISFLNKSNASKIVYISCNPKTLKRDIDKLNNYELKEISAFSMFPRTKHSEMIILFERR